MSQKDSPFFWFLIFFSFVSIAFITYLWVRWVRPQKDQKRRRASTVLLLTLGILLFLQPMLYRDTLDVRDWGPTALAWISYCAMGFFALFLIYSLGWDLVFLLGRTWVRLVRGKKAYAQTFNSERRQWLWKASRLGIASVSLGTGTVGIWQGLQGPRLVEVEVPIKDLHPDLDGFRITQVSDLHIGPTIASPYVQDVVDLVQSTRPDAIALTGDLVDGSVAQLGEDAQLLSSLSAPHGVYFCTGNHEYFSGAQPWIDYWTQMGIHVLGNSHRLISVGAARLLMGGVYDRTGSRFIPEHTCDPSASLLEATGRSALAHLKVLLAHQPTTCTDAHQAGFDLMLSGHTHGGQFFPWSLFVPLAHPYNRGLHLHRERMWVYVNSGTGYWGPPMRFGLPAEVTALTLKRVI